MSPGGSFPGLGRLLVPVECFSEESFWCTIRAYGKSGLSCEWDPRKAEVSFKKHGVRFSEAEPVFSDDLAVTNTDDESDPDEQRFVSIGTGVRGRILAVVYCRRGSKIRIVSARPAEAHERKQYEENR
jgi:uncharacterized DUF497 family protein